MQPRSQISPLPVGRKRNTFAQIDMFIISESACRVRAVRFGVFACTRVAERKLFISGSDFDHNFGSSFSSTAIYWHLKLF